MNVILKILIGILNLIFSLMKLLPTRRKVTFISRQSNEMSDDMKLLQKSLKNADRTVETVFLCKTMGSGLLAKIGYCFHIFRQMYHIATSKVVVLDSYCIPISVLKQRSSLAVIQMWHALGSLKKFGLSIVGENEGRNAEVAEAMAMHKNYTYVLTSSEACAPYFGEAFGYGREKLKVASLPRVDRLTDGDYARETVERITAEYPEMKDKKVVVYTPTFRMDRDVSEEIDRLASQFDENEYVFVLKKHPLMKVDCKNCLVDDKFSSLEMIFAADYVVCDYSAIVFEAAIIGKPLFFYTFDYETYGVDRDFYIDYMKEMPGVISANPALLAKAIKDDEYSLERVKAFSKKYVDNQEHCSDKLAEMIIENL